MKAIKANLTVTKLARFAGDVYRVECASDDNLPQISAGQFAHIKVPNKDLRRPICVYDNTENSVTFIIAQKGEGTRSFVERGEGARFDALLPLGNGFPIMPDITNVAVIGGWTGCAPLLKIAKDNPWINCTALLGFPNADAAKIYGDDFDRYCKRVCYCTDDGSLGYHGYPTDILTEIAPDVVYVCGAMGMVKTVKEFCAARGTLGFASMEQRMGCGVGACLVCSVKIERDGKIINARACADGPVFPIKEIVV